MKRPLSAAERPYEKEICQAYQRPGERALIWLKACAAGARYRTCL